MQDSLPTRDYTNLLMTNTDNIVGCIGCRLPMWSDVTYPELLHTLPYCTIRLLYISCYFAQRIVV